LRAAVKVKICGITRRKDLNHTVDAGADAVGFVVGVPSSPRNISIEEARELARHVPIFSMSVLVMVPKSLNELVEAYEAVNPDAIQVHGNLINEETFGSIEIGCNIIKGLNLEPNHFIDPGSTQYFDALLLDTYVPGKYGGTGVAQNWEFCSKLRRTIHPKKLILAGGLKVSNVQKAIQIVEPYAVDVSTGVESSPGVKDPRKIELFIKQVREMKP
jgi:phosphoribosylanthranilate isomerase